jgi:methylamine---glutamate N-methyltransferase subunit A
MCGIAGFLRKDAAADGPVGERLLSMARILGSRGLESTGMALYAELPADQLVMRVHLEAPSEAEVEARRSRLLERIGTVATVLQSEQIGPLVRVVIGGVADRSDLACMRRLTDLAEATGDAEVFSIGAAMEIVKDVGPADELSKRHCVSTFRGTHGLAHTRLATESRVDICHSHPFWARPFPDIAVVHNGQLTNHHKLRRRFERRGFHFLTENDSEVIAVFVADRLSQGGSLEQALVDSIEELDGTFTYLVSTAEGLGFAKDRFATKPLVVAECDDYVAMASEEIGLAPILTTACRVYEPEAREVRTWSR